ncbi:MAG: hypothetical protein ACI8QC_000319 [Planctomycetota bacterium]|jgi:hypothetical protein
MTTLTKLVFATAGTLALASAAHAQGGDPILINEIRIDQGGSDNDEYAEIMAGPGTNLTGLTYIVIGDGATGPGSFDNVTSLDGFIVPASGIFVMAEATFTIGVADATVNLNFENSDNVTHLLVAGYDGTTTDIDTDDDGVQDVTPWTAVIDGLALIEDPVGGDPTYWPTTLGPDGSFVPAHAIRCASGWAIGEFSIVLDTPGAANRCEGIEGCAAVANSTGDIGQLAFLSSNASGASIDFRAYDLPVGEMGYFIAARNFGEIPFAGGSDGTLCAVSNTARFVMQTSTVDVNGFLDATLDMSMVPNTPTVSTIPGETWYFQCWHRDGLSSNFTETLEITFQ